jgi:hypothetical protein
MGAAYQRSWAKSLLFTHKDVRGNSPDCTVPREPDFREGFSIQLWPLSVTEGTPTALMRQVLGAIAQFDKAGSRPQDRRRPEVRRPQELRSSPAGDGRAGASAAPSRSRSSAGLLAEGRGRTCRARLRRVNRRALRSCGRRVYASRIDTCCWRRPHTAAFWQRPRQRNDEWDWLRCAPARHSLRAGP